MTQEYENGSFEFGEWRGRRRERERTGERESERERERERGGVDKERGMKNNYEKKRKQNEQNEKC